MDPAVYDAGLVPPVGRWLVRPALAGAVCACGSPQQDVVAVVQTAADAAPDAAPGGASCSLPLLASADGGPNGVCLGDFAARAFAWALCSCGDLSAGGLLATDALGGSSEAGASGAPVGVDGALLAQLAKVGGDLTVASSGPLTLVAGMQVNGTLRLGGPATVGGLLGVVGTAWLEQGATALGAATIGGDLHLGPGSNLVAVTSVVAGTTTGSEPFTTAAPCSCAPGAVDVAGLVAAAQTRNDDAAAGLDADAWSGAAAAVTLPCGAYYAHAVTAPALQMRVTGQVALFVDGDVSLGPAFALSLDPGAATDWFVRGNLSVAAGARIGDPSRPGATRLYVLGSGAIALPGTSAAAASLYAPNAAVSVAALGDVYGSIYAAAISGATGLSIHYDPSAAVEPCAATPGGG